MQNHADGAARINNVPRRGRFAEYPGARPVLPRKLRNQPCGLDSARRLRRGGLEHVGYSLIRRAAYLYHVLVNDVNGIAPASSRGIYAGVLCAVLELAMSGVGNQIAVFKSVLFSRNRTVAVRGENAK